MTTVKSAKDKGRRWNTAIARYLVERGWPHAETRATNGAKDRGDITGVMGVMIEAKAELHATLGTYMAEVSVQRMHAVAPVGVVWMKRPGFQQPAQGLVAMHLSSLAQLRFDGDLLGELYLSRALADADAMPTEANAALLLKRPKGHLAVAAVTGENFVLMLKSGGY